MDGFLPLYLALHLIDWGQTMNIQQDPVHYREINPLIGAHPSRGDVNRYFIGSTIFVYTADKYVFKKNKVFRFIVISLAVAAVVRNKTIGLKVRF